ncbi:TadE/TadG family type IV pilus assembly protein [Tindallia californiensis]|uniref:TadE-like protein n=1 Tax=Tindallia californiensis TaxID=159292 RepID=A0A1H3M5X4_9FIRM|nr:TadE/TadG family type IV pilus assembly protein [Tindallia californiensis]SDY72003.1 TadE-like protein [Tindallia californiensis]
MAIKHLKSEKGQSLVEFALILPILLILMSFTLDVAQAINSKMNVQHLAGEMVKAHKYFHQGGHENPGDDLFFDSRDDLIDHLLDKSPLNADELTYNIIEGEVRDRHFIGKRWHQTGTNSFGVPIGRFFGTNNSNTVQYITVEVEYVLNFSMILTKTVLGDSLTLSETFTTAMYLGSDGDWPDPL